MEIRIMNNHLVIPVQTNIGERITILDTGNPISTFFNEDNITNVVFDGIDFTIENNEMSRLLMNMIDWNQITNLIGIEVHGILGYDFLSAYDILIDLNKNKLHLNQKPEKFELIDIYFHMNIPILEIKIQDLNINAIFDTGAMHSILNTQHINLLNNLYIQIDEYNPMLGNFTAHLYEGNIQIGNTLLKNCKIATSENYDRAMQMVRYENLNGFLGIGSLIGKKIFLSYQFQKFGIQN